MENDNIAGKEGVCCSEHWRGDERAVHILCTASMVSTDTIVHV